MRKIILGSALILGLSAHAQKQIIATYDQGRQTISVHAFINRFDEEEADKLVTFGIGYLNGIPVANPYFSTGACQSMQVNKAGDKLYFFLTDRLPENAAGGWTSGFVYEFKTKSIRKLFTVTRQNYLIWRLIEERNSIVYYDKKYTAFIEKSLGTKPADTLIRIDVNTYETYLQADSNGLLFYGLAEGKLHKWEYNFYSGRNELTKLAPANHFCGAYNDKVLFVPAGSSKVQLLGSVPSAQDSVPYNVPWMHWLSKETFCTANDNFIRVYNLGFHQVAEYEVEKVYILGAASGGLLIGYVENNQRILMWLTPGLSSEKRISDIRSHMVYLVSELP